VSFHTRDGVVKAVAGVSYQLARGETLGIVGESGSGKSVSCQALLGLLPSPPARIEGGKALFVGRDLLTLKPAELRKLRGDKIAMVFQDPMTSLNPFLKIGTQLVEPLREHRGVRLAEARLKALQAMREVGIQAPERRFSQYPHELSGGMRQRVMIAMALITDPELLVADEPTTALDVTVQAQILELLKRLSSGRGMAVLFVTHDLGAVARLCDRVVVMYAGRVMESGSVEDVFYRAAHPYTIALRRSLPDLDHPAAELYCLPGMPPDPSVELPGCPFAPRCELAQARCRQLGPIPMVELSPGHQAACLLLPSHLLAHAP